MEKQNDWEPFLQQQRKQPYYQKMIRFVNDEYASKTVYPAKEDVFNCFRLTPLNKVKVVILGQDPYHQPNQACGLSFAVKPGVKLPPSLRNIYQELADDLKIPPANHGYLLPWAKQGVLLLNTVLTVVEGQPNSHKECGWTTFTDHVLQHVDQHCPHVVFILWGKNAIDKQRFINTQKHRIISSVHPSPLSAYRGFFGSKPFSKTNEYLKQWQMSPIDWSLNDV